MRSNLGATASAVAPKAGRRLFRWTRDRGEHPPGHRTDPLVFVAGLVEDQVSPGREDFGMIGDLVDGGEPHAERSRRPGVVGLVSTGDLAKRVQVATTPSLVNLPRTPLQVLWCPQSVNTAEFQTVSSSRDAMKVMRSASASFAFCVSSCSSVPPPPRSLRMFARLPRWSDDLDSVVGSPAVPSCPLLQSLRARYRGQPTESARSATSSVETRPQRAPEPVGRRH